MPLLLFRFVIVSADTGSQQVRPVGALKAYLDSEFILLIGQDPVGINAVPIPGTEQRRH